MDKKQFINEVFLRYPPETTEGLDFAKIRNDYVTAITTNEEVYDYETALKDIFKTYEYQKTPSPFHLRQYLKKHVKSKTYKYPKFTSIWADRGGLTYEFGIISTEEQTRKELKAMGFTNIRMKRKQNSLL